MGCVKKQDIWDVLIRRAAAWNNPTDPPIITPRLNYMPYEGPINRRMPKLINTSRNPISPSLFSWRRLEVLDKYLGALKRADQRGIEVWKPLVETYWDNNVVYTGFGVAKHRDKGVVLVPDAEKHLKEPILTRLLSLPSSFLSGVRYAILPDGVFEQLKDDGHAHYTHQEISQYGDQHLPQEQALSSPFWRDLIPDENLRNASIVNVFDQYKTRFGYDEPKLMGVFFPHAQKRPVMSCFSIGALKHLSDAEAYHNLNDSGGLLIGVRPEVKVGDVHTLEHIVQYN